MKNTVTYIQNSTYMFWRKKSKKKIKEDSIPNEDQHTTTHLPGIDNTMVIPSYPMVLKENSHKPVKWKKSLIS